jgi:putative ABC transport system permease protein
MNFTIKYAIRKLVKSKSYTVINVFGISISLVVALVILLFSTFHFSFDKHVDNYRNSYRLISRYGDGAYNANTFACFEEDLQKMKEVEKMTVCFTQHNANEVFVRDQSFSISDLAFIDDSFFDYFGLRIIEGVPETINQPNMVFLTPSMAVKLFNDEPPIGKSIELRAFTSDANDRISFTVGGIVAPMPNTSHLEFEMLISKEGHFASTVERTKTIKAFAAATYVKLLSSVNVGELEKQLISLPEAKIGYQHGPPLDAFNHKLQPLSEIHFTADTVTESKPTIRRSALYILMAVGFLILLISVIDFVNLYAATSTFRRREFGVIRTFGGSQRHLWFSMATEILLMLIFSFILTVALFIVFNTFFLAEILSDWRISFYNPRIWGWTLLLFLFTSVLIIVAGSFDFIPNRRYTEIKNPLHKSRTIIQLVTFQYVLVIGLMAFAILLNKQMNFINEKSLGYSADNVIIIESPQRNEKVLVCRNELQKIPGVIQSAIVHHYPGYRLQDMIFGNGESSFPFKFGMVGSRAIEALDIELLHSFVPDLEKAGQGWLINETFYHNLLDIYSEEQIRTSNFPSDENDSDSSRQEFRILGVVGDFHYASLHSPIENFAFNLQSTETNFNRFMLVRYNQKNHEAVLEASRKTLAGIFPGYPFEYAYLNEQVQNQYESEKMLMKLVNVFSILCIIVACMGLLGITLFMLEKRTKEIGIRKVNGARISEILIMLNKDFVKWVAIAFVIATPIAYYVMNQWLQNFTYKTELSWWIFALAGLLALGIALLTVSWQSWRAARRNSVEALRYE